MFQSISTFSITQNKRPHQRGRSNVRGKPVRTKTAGKGEGETIDETKRKLQNSNRYDDDESRGDQSTVSTVTSSSSLASPTPVRTEPPPSSFSLLQLVDGGGAAANVVSTALLGRGGSTGVVVRHLEDAIEGAIQATGANPRQRGKVENGRIGTTRAGDGKIYARSDQGEYGKGDPTSSAAELPLRGHKMCLGQVRLLATKMGYKEIDCDDTINHVVSFVTKKNHGDTSRGTNEPVRLNVYYKTGTVSVCRVLRSDGVANDVASVSSALGVQDAGVASPSINSVASTRSVGEVRQVFHRRCTMAKLKCLLRQPSHLTLMNGDDKRLIQAVVTGASADDDNSTAASLRGLYSRGSGSSFATRSDLYKSSGSTRSIGSNTTKGSSVVEELDGRLRDKVDLADLALAILVSERDTIATHASYLEKEESNQRRDDEAGRNFQYSVLPFQDEKDNNDKVEKCLDVKPSITCVSTNGYGTVVLYGDKADWAYTPGIPKLLRNKLHGRQRTLPPPTYVSIGTRHRYYVRFADGADQWFGPKELDFCLKESGKAVSSVSFGKDWHSFIVVYEDGSWEHSGIGIPTGLQQLLDDVGDRRDLACVSIGPSMEWFVKRKNEKPSWGGLSRSLNRVIESIEASITFLDFGDHGTYFIRYSDYDPDNL